MDGVLTGIHFLLTYACTHECDHCFLHCGPRAEGTFTSAQLRRVFGEIERIGTIESVYFEGGEPFLFYPLLLDGLGMAARLQLNTGVVTNAYWATSVEDARIWLQPIRDLGVKDLSISDDAFHHGDGGDSPAGMASAAARELGIPCETICIEAPAVLARESAALEKGQPVVGGDVRFRGRAAEKLSAGLPTQPWQELTSCPDEDLETPRRVHLDSFGNVHICQGLSMGNMWETPLSELVRRYDAATHPICGPLLSGGPAELATEYGVRPRDGYVGECHCCYGVRKDLVGRFPGHLGPRQVYGLE